MVVLEKLKAFATGKTAEEREKEAERMKIIRSKALEESLKERERQAINLAREKEKISGQRKLAKARQPAWQNYWANIQYGSPMGQSRSQRNQRIVTTIKRKGKKGRVITRRVTRQVPIRRRNYIDVMGL